MARELVAAARAGDERAFAQLVEAEAPRIYRAVLAVVWSPEDAQEVVQDATVRAWRQLGGLRDETRWPGWYRRIAVRQAIDRARKLGDRRVREIDVGSVDSNAGTDPSGQWTERVAIMEALSHLTPDDRTLLGLRFGADLEVPDIAAALDVPLGTVKSRLHRALGRLAQAMGGRDVR